MEVDEAHLDWVCPVKKAGKKDAPGYWTEHHKAIRSLEGEVKRWNINANDEHMHRLREAERACRAEEAHRLAMSENAGLKADLKEVREDYDQILKLREEEFDERDALRAALAQACMEMRDCNRLCEAQNHSPEVYEESLSTPAGTECYGQGDRCWRHARPWPCEAKPDREPCPNCAHGYHHDRPEPGCRCMFSGCSFLPALGCPGHHALTVRGWETVYHNDGQPCPSRRDE